MTVQTIAADAALPDAAPIVVIDFETTGSSPGQGARATEIAAVRVHQGRIVDHFQSLMKTGVWVPPFIEQLTGISNQMLAQAPPAHEVMHEVLRFARGCPLVAHNAAFDRSFWLAEAMHAGAEPDAAHHFACTVRLARRLYPDAPNHRLGTLARWHHLPDQGRAHRALADARTTAELLLHIQHDLAERLVQHGQPAEQAREHGLLCRVQQTPASKLDHCLRQGATPRPAAPPVWA